MFSFMFSVICHHLGSVIIWIFFCSTHIYSKVKKISKIKRGSNKKTKPVNEIEAKESEDKNMSPENMTVIY